VTATIDRPAAEQERTAAPPRSRIRRLTQAGAFTRKELTDVLGQPRLLLLLVVGPFLVLLVFGLGYRETPDPYRTEIVAEPGSVFAEEVDAYTEELSQLVDIRRVGNDEAGARARLQAGELDLVVIFPDDAVDWILDGNRAPVVVLHTRLDPVEEVGIRFAARLAAQEVNTAVLAQVVSSGQESITPAHEEMAASVDAANRARSAVRDGDEEEAETALDDLDRSIRRVEDSVRASTGLTVNLGGREDAEQASRDVDEALARVSGTSSRLRTNLAEGDDAQAQTEAERLADEAITAQEALELFQELDPEVVARPFEVYVETAVEGERTYTDFYAPAALILVLQQFAVAFGALSFVRERQLGMLDVYRVGPIGPFQTVLGKYVAYLLLGGAVGAVLAVAIVYGLGVPLLGSWWQLALVIGLVLAASVGLGFLISLISTSDSQAVQYSMLVLLASLFFSGFFLSLAQLAEPVRAFSWLLPATSGMALTRGVMLRGDGLRAFEVAVLVALVAGTLLLSVAGTRRVLGRTS
jgi:ABC-2 type transport system permease protein